VVFHYPVNPSEHFVKRVIGVPGDRLRIINRQVYVNGSALREPYARYVSPAVKDRAARDRSADEVFRDEFPRLDISAPGMEGEWWLQMKKLVEEGELIIPEGHYFVLGDNRDDSLDSRYWGFVPRENIIGRPLLIYWSVRSTDEDMPVSSTPGDKLHHFAYAVSHLFQLTRWNRTFRVVN
jgi:signal peptidase I